MRVLALLHILQHRYGNSLRKQGIALVFLRRKGGCAVKKKLVKPSKARKSTVVAYGGDNCGGGCSLLKW